MELLSTIKDPFLFASMSRYTREMLRNNSLADRISGYTRAAAFTYFLGGLLKSAVVNLAQNPIVGFAELAKFVWFSETQTGYTGQANSPLLGVHEGRAIYLLYNGILKDKSVGGGNVLTGPVFEVLPKFSGPKVIYAAANRLGTRTARESITIKQTPYALEL